MLANTETKTTFAQRQAIKLMQDCADKGMTKNDAVKLGMSEGASEGFLYKTIRDHGITFLEDANTIKLVLDQPTFARLVAVAKARGVTVDDVVYAGIEDVLANHGPIAGVAV